MQETQVQSMGWEGPLEKELATHSSILVQRILMDRGGWRATVHGIARVGHDLATKPPPPQTMPEAQPVSEFTNLNKSANLLLQQTCEIVKHLARHCHIPT